MIRVDDAASRGALAPRTAKAAALGLCLLGMPLAHAAETVTCVDAAGEIGFSYGVDPDLAQPILWVEMQLTGDFGLSTDPAHGKFDGDYVAKGFVGDGVEGGDVAWRDDGGREHLAMSFRIGRVYEAREGHIAGAVSVDGGGLWTVTCTAAEPDEASMPPEMPANTSYLCRSVRTNRQIGRLEHEEDGLVWFDSEATPHMGSRLTARIDAGQLYVTGGRLFERYGLVWTTLAPEMREGAAVYAFYHATGPVVVCTSPASGEAD